MFFSFISILSGVIDPKGIMGLDNGLVPNRLQAIIWTNDDSVQRCIKWHYGDMS